VGLDLDGFEQVVAARLCGLRMEVILSLGSFEQLAAMRLGLSGFEQVVNTVNTDGRAL